MQNLLNKKDKAIVALTTQTSLSYNKIKLIIETLEDVSVIFSTDADVKLYKILSTTDICEINKINERVLNNYLNTLQDRNIEVVTIYSSIYPKLLKEIYNPPFILYAKGDLSLLNHESTLAVVGTRRCTKYGEEVTKQFVKTLANEDVCIVSGLADGIDTIAHQSCLNVNGKTIAVIGSGFDNVYPANNINLARKIVDKGGLVLTEYMLSEKPQTYHFPARNRIIAGLSKGVLIIEAPMRSGALITKEYALEFNRELFVVPGRINDIYSKGSNEVIRSCQGSMVLTAQDVLQAYNKCLDGVGESKRVQLSIEEELIYKTLEMGEKHYETLLIETGLGASQLNILLTKLELMGVVAKLPGNIYTITMN